MTTTNMFKAGERLQRRLKAFDNPQFNELAELLEMQQALDTAILKDKGITEYPAENIKIALFVELGEMLNELPKIFKYWKDTAKNDRQKALIEYVDALHFALSLTNFYGNDREINFHSLFEYYDYKITMFREMAQLDIWTLIATIPEQLNKGVALKGIFEIGNYLNFTWGQVYDAYKEKNAVNYERLKSGY